MKSKQEINKKDKIISSLEDANKKLVNKKEEYENNNRDWEIKVTEIINKFNELENENMGKLKSINFIDLKRTIEELTKSNETIDFKLKIANEKTKIHDTSYSKLKNLHDNYDDSLCDLKNEFKKKEAILKEKYIQLENELKQIYDEKINEKNEFCKKTNKKVESIQKINDSVFI